MAWPRIYLIIVGFCVAAIMAEPTISAPPRLMVVAGTPGEEDYAVQFRAWGQRWRDVFPAEGVQWLDGTQASSPETSVPSHRDQILAWIERTSESPVEETYWMVFLGHGTFDRTGAKFNLAGPDLSSRELAKALENSIHRWVVINCSSSSGPFVSSLSGPNRIIISATKSGSEQNYSRFGDYFSRSLRDPASDLDHDLNISVLEAFLAASSGVARYYEEQGRLASEQSLLDDNGDKRGTPAAFFRGIRAVKAPADGLKLDGEIARRTVITSLGEGKPIDEQILKQVDDVERRLDQLRQEKGKIPDDEYYAKLEPLARQLADLLIDR
jgi:hypothetical protein